MQNKTKRLSVLLGLALGAPAVVAPVVIPSHAPAAFAQESREYPDVPQNHWAYAAINKLSQAGLIGGMPNSAYMGKRPMTRYEFAVAVARILEKVGAEPVGVQGATGEACAQCMQVPAETIPGVGEFVKRPELIDAISALRIEFEPEMKALGLRFDDHDKRIIDDLVKPGINPIMPTTGSVAHYIEYPDVPRNHWAYLKINALSHAGFFEGIPNGTCMGNKLMTRFEFALTLAHFLENVDPARPQSVTVPRGATGDRSQVGLSSADAKIPYYWAKRPGWADDIKALCNEFAPELNGLGIHVDDLEKRIINVYDVIDVLKRPTTLPITPNRLPFGSSANYISAGNDGRVKPKNQ